MSVSLLTLAERLIAARQWRQGAQCLRCLHTSRPHRADQGTGGETVDSSTLPRSSLRHQRAARISQEVSALHSNPSTNTDPNTVIASAAASTARDQSHTAAIDAHPSSNGASQGILGQNSSPGREGPFAQPVGRLDDGREAESKEKFSSQGLGARTPDGKSTDPASGGTALLDSQTQPLVPTAAASYASNLKTAIVSPTAPSASHAELVATLIGSTPLPVLPITPQTAAGSRAQRAHLASHLHSLHPTPRPQSSKRTHYLPGAQADALLATRAELRAEAAVAREALGPGSHDFRELPQDLKKKFYDNRRALKGTAKERNAAVRAKIGETLREKFVVGRYDPRGLLGGEGKGGYGREVLDSVARGLLRNGTYVGKDAERVVAKVRSLLPALPAGGGAGTRARAAK